MVMLYLPDTSAYCGHSEVNVMGTKNSSDPRRPPQPADDGDEVEIPPAGEATVETRDKPPRAPAGKTIHPRRPLPAVPDADRSDKD
jgi:hypothetical protein